MKVIRDIENRRLAPTQQFFLETKNKFLKPKLIMQKKEINK